MTQPNNRKNSQHAIAERRRSVAALYVRGSTQWEIARQLKVSQATICTDLAAVRAEWLASSVRDFDAKKAEELAKLDHVEAQAWEGWQRSQRDAETLHVETAKGRTGKDSKPLPDLTKSSKTVKGQSGDPRFLAEVRECCTLRLKLIGALKDQVANVNQVVALTDGTGRPLPLQQFGDELLQVLRPYPEARVAVAAQFKAMANGNGHAEPTGNDV